MARARNSPRGPGSPASARRRFFRYRVRSIFRMTAAADSPAESEASSSSGALFARSRRGPDEYARTRRAHPPGPRKWSIDRSQFDRFLDPVRRLGLDLGPVWWLHAARKGMDVVFAERSRSFTLRRVGVGRYRPHLRDGKAVHVRTSVSVTRSPVVHSPGAKPCSYTHRAASA
jgi:hypothetical protein